MDMRSEVSGKGTFSRATLTRRKNYNVHTLRLQIDPRKRK
jgi:hypothetical protein